MLQKCLDNVKLLLPVGTHVTLNPKLLKDAGHHLGVLDDNGRDIINFNHDHEVAYSEGEVYCIVISYEIDSKSSNVFYIALMPEEKDDTIIFVRLTSDLGSSIDFLTLIDLDS